MSSKNNISDTVDKLQKEFFYLNRLFDLAKIVNQSADVFELSEKILNFIIKNCEVENAALFLKLDEYYNVVSSVNLESPDEYIFRNEDESIWTLLSSGKPFLTIDEKGRILFDSFFANYNLEGLNSAIWLPILYNNNIIGIISLGKKIDQNTFDDEDIDFFEKLLDYVVPVINKLNLQSKKESEIAELQKTLHNISILYSIGQTMNFIDDLKALLKIILDKAIKNIGAEKGSLMLYDISSNELVVKVVYGLPDKEAEEKINEGLIECTRITVGEGIAGSVFLNKTPIITNLGVNDPRFAKGAKSGNVSSILCIPLIVKGESIGVINITNKKDGKLFNQNDLEFIAALANQAAIAIDNAQLYELATKDGLTKLYIHRHFYTLLDNEIKRSARYNHKLSVFMIDIDDFKAINDTYGHKIGDQILRELASVVTHTIRKIDLAARYGGEEFAVILPETPIESAQIIADRLRKNISDITVRTSEGLDISTTVSIGMAEFPVHADNCDEIIEKADKALYYAKNNGKNRVAQYDENGCFIV